jgi:hypothetical protein
MPAHVPWSNPCLRPATPSVHPSYWHDWASYWHDWASYWHDWASYWHDWVDGRSMIRRQTPVHQPQILQAIVP